MPVIEEAKKESDGFKKSVLLTTTLASFLTPFMSSSINVALPSVGRKFAMDAVLLTWVATSFLLAVAMFLLPFGRVADIQGRKKTFTWGMVVYVVASLFCALSTSPSLLISFRVLQGVGSAMFFGTSVAILTSVFPPGERGKALGINVAAVYLGLSLGPFLGGFLTQHYGWRAIFLVNIPLGLIIVLFIILKLKGEWAEAKGERFDWRGSVIYSLSLVAMMYGFSRLPAAAGALFLIGGIFGIFAFIRWESRVRNPVLNVNIFRSNRVFAFSNLAALINYSASAAVAFLLSLYLQYVKGISPQNAGLILVSQPVIQAVFSPFAGKLSDRVEPRIVASLGMGTTAAGIFLLSFLNEKTALNFIVGCLMLLGFGFALFSSPNTNAVMSSVDKKFYGVASGTLATMRLVGQMLSMGIAMLLFSVFMGRVEITPEHSALLVKSVKVALGIFAALGFGGVFASLARGRVNR
jgi:EmrB/QacA subfamily drug resistance transporter